MGHFIYKYLLRHWKKAFSSKKAQILSRPDFSIWGKYFSGPKFIFAVCRGAWVWGANHLAVLLVCFDISQLSSCDLFQLSSVLLNDWMVCKLLWCFQVITFDDCHGQQWLCATLWKFLINMCLTHTLAHQFYSQWSIPLSLFCEWNWNLVTAQPLIVCFPTARGQATASSVNTLLSRAPTPPDGVKVNLWWQPWSAMKPSDKCEQW